jgi:hypothetical protein
MADAIAIEPSSARSREVDRAQEPQPSYGDRSTLRLGSGGWLLCGAI